MYKYIKVIVDIYYKRFIIFQSLYCLNTPQNVDALFYSLFQYGFMYEYIMHYNILCLYDYTYVVLKIFTCNLYL